MNVRKAAQIYRAWPAEYTTLVPANLAFKHLQIATGAFPFLRSTFYRSAQTFQYLPPTGECPGPTDRRLGSLGTEQGELRLLRAMGWETANIHLGSPAVIKDVQRDWKEWKQSGAQRYGVIT